MENIKRYKFSGLAMFGLVLLDIVVLVLYVVCLGMMNSDESNQYLPVAANVLIVFFSVLSTSIVSVPMIEVREKNKLCQQMLMEDMLGNPKFFDSLTDEEKAGVLKSLEANMHFESDAVKGEMYQSIRKKVGSSHSLGDHYFSSCKHIIHCEVKGDVMQKRIIKETRVLSYQDMDVSNFPLCKMLGIKINGVDCLNITSLKIGEKTCNPKDDVEEKEEEVTDSLMQKKGYTSMKSCFYKHSLHFSPTSETVIQVEYTVVVPLNDKSSVYRVGVPCKRFEFQFNMEGAAKDQYLLSLNAFGFVDDGHTTLNRSGTAPTVRVELNDWIFPGDGVALAILEKSQVPAGTEA